MRQTENDWKRNNRRSQEDGSDDVRMNGGGRSCVRLWRYEPRGNNSADPLKNQYYTKNGICAFVCCILLLVEYLASTEGNNRTDCGSLQFSPEAGLSAHPYV